MKPRGSLRHKITFGYYAVGTLIVAASLFTFVELRLIEQRMAAGERISEFFDAVLEIRRFEKNYVLYHQNADYLENTEYVERALALLAENAGEFVTPPRFAGLGTDIGRYTTLTRELAGLRGRLEQYTRLMAEYARLPARAGPAGVRLEQQIRRTGKEVVTVAEDIATNERMLLRASLDRHRRTLVLTLVVLIVLVVGIGHALSRRVARPLKEMEDSMEAIASGNRNKLDIRSNDREIVSLTNAFHHVLDELALRQQHLVRSEKLASLGTLLSGVAHELNNPLSNISTSCQILMEELEEADPAYQRELLGQIDEQTIRARNIVRSLLDFARDREFKHEPLNVAQLAQETLRFLKGQVPREVTVRTDIAVDLVIDADKQRLQQALLNLVKNAVEALEGAGEIRLSAARHAAPDTGTMDEQRHFQSFGQCASHGEVEDIEVHDNGHGIPPEILPRVFDPFFTTKEVGKGSGLGLFIVYEIVEQHGGCLAVATSPTGTTFRIRLPANPTKHHD